MTLIERVRARQNLCTRCGRHEPYPGLLTCAPCTERLVAPKVPPFSPAWRNRLVAKDMTRAA